MTASIYRTRSTHRVLNRIAHQGFTLIEVMVAMIIGLVLVMALAGIYMSLKQNFFGQGNLSTATEQQRLLYTSLATSVQSAGYYADPVSYTRANLFPAVGSFATGQFVAGNASTLSVRYQALPGDGIADCAGAENTGTSAIIITNSFSLNTANHTLECTSSTGGSPVALASNIASLQFLYGTDTDKDGLMDRYLSADAVTSDGLWSYVSSVRVVITLTDNLSQSRDDVVGNRIAASAAMPTTLVQHITLMNTYEVL
ncbi:PilW family protein [Comamonas odontotermitis]|uniref:PilW family protein n=1 Tax=Comamonas odontotermitis TaxID=379895 RepID=UPI00366EFACD